jgi:hypothetical protein
MSACDSNNRRTRGALLALLLLAGAAHGADVGILLPLYVYPYWWNASLYVWPQVAQAGARVPITAIINPASGPGLDFPNPDYRQGISDLAAGGVRMVGYVYTSYGARSLPEVKSDIDAYTNSPLITGVFLDEAASGTNELAYYRELYAHVRSRTNYTQVIVNPGNAIAQSYLSQPAADTAVIFEGGSDWPEYQPDAYVTNYAAGRFAMLVHGCAAVEAMRTNVDLAVQRNVGWVYVTDDVLKPDPWDSLAGYWTNLVDYVAAYRGVRITEIAAGTGGVSLACAAVPGRPARVEWSGALPATNWAAATGTLVPTGVVLHASDTNAPAAQRYYRLRLLP